MSDLVAFLRARLDEDEAVARSSADAFRFMQGGDYSGVWTCGQKSHYPEVDQHIARWDPVRVLAEVAAKRAVLDLHQLIQRDHMVFDPNDESAVRPIEIIPTDDCNACDGWPCPTLLALAQPFADHPDFDPAWRLT